jgi:hypothetical protein
MRALTLSLVAVATISFAILIGWHLGDIRAKSNLSGFRLPIREPVRIVPTGPAAGKS